MFVKHVTHYFRHLNILRLYGNGLQADRSLSNHDKEGSANVKEKQSKARKRMKINRPF